MPLVVKFFAWKVTVGAKAKFISVAASDVPALGQPRLGSFVVFSSSAPQDVNGIIYKQGTIAYVTAQTIGGYTTTPGIYGAASNVMSFALQASIPQLPEPPGAQWHFLSCLALPLKTCGAGQVWVNGQ